MDWSRLGVTWEETALVVVATLGIYAGVVTYARVSGQRSLAAFSAFDFAVSVAAGSVVGRVVLVNTSLVAGIIGLGVLFLLQAVIGRLRNRTWLTRIIDNAPVLLVRDGKVIEENLRRAHLRVGDVYERMRMDGLGDLSSARAVVLERNGNISVIRAEEPISAEVFGDIPGWPTSNEA